jgi:putative ABC transport system permease protein
MYPNLTPTLVGLLAVAFAASIYIALRRPVLRKLALRQVSRRRREAALVVLGSMLGTAIVVGSLIVGDTLNFSVKQAAYENLGPIDETVTSTGVAQGQEIAARLASLRGDPAVDGLLTAHGDLAAVTTGTGSSRVAEPRVGVWDLDFGQAAAFGGSNRGGSGLTGPAPTPGRVVINQNLATAMSATVGDALTFYLYGRPVTVRVARVVPTRGIAGMPIDGVTKDAFFAPQTLVEAARTAATASVPRSFTFVSNAGGVETGSAASASVVRRIDAALRPLGAGGFLVETSKQTVLDQAKRAGDSLGSMFLMIGSFAIIAGILLLVIIFVMLAEERKPELGMLRAIGMKRSRLVRSFIVEGTVYALVASLLGIVVGLGVGRAVVIVAGRIFSGYDTGEGALHLVFHVTAISVVNGFALGFLIALATVALTSMRISRINIIAAIRDLPPDDVRRMKRRWVAASAILAVVFGALAVQAVRNSQGFGTYLFPALTALFACPVLLQVAPKRWVYSGVALAILGWSLAANSLRPHLLDDVGPATFVVLGLLLTVSAVVLISENQRLVAAPLRPLVDRTTQAGLSTRLGLAYPLGKRFRTGSILIMYGLVVFTLVFITVLSALVDATVSRQVTSASGGYSVRVDYNPAAPIADPVAAFTTGPLAGKVAGVVPLLVARGEVTDLTPTVTDPVDAVVVGADPAITEAGMFPLTESIADPTGDRDAWTVVLSDPRFVIVDRFLGQLNSGGPPRTLFHVGDTLVLTDPRTGAKDRKTIAGILDSSFGFYGMGGGLYSPVIMSTSAARTLFGSGLHQSSALVKAAPGVPDQWLASSLQGRFLTNGLVATRIRHAVEQNFAANRGFFQLMQGFIALGLIVGIAGLGVMMVRAVRERRRSIGVLRALGFQARTVQRAFLTESLFVTVEGVVIGAGLSVLTAYLLFKNDEMFKTAGGGFSVPWLAIAVLVALATVASVLATMWPARQASRIRPAVAIRIAD